MTLFNSDWSDCMSCPASSAQKAMTYNRPDELPTTGDLMKLNQYTETRLDELTEQLQAEPSYIAWRALSEIVLARLVVFNKRRGGQPAKLLLSQLFSRPDWKQSSNKELINNLRPV